MMNNRRRLRERTMGLHIVHYCYVWNMGVFGDNGTLWTGHFVAFRTLGVQAFPTEGVATAEQSWLLVSFGRILQLANWTYQHSAC